MPCFQVTISKISTRASRSHFKLLFKKGRRLPTIFRGLLEKEFKQNMASNALFSGHYIEKFRLALRARIFELLIGKKRGYKQNLRGY